MVRYACRLFEVSECAVAGIRASPASPLPVAGMQLDCQRVASKVQRIALDLVTLSSHQSFNGEGTRVGIGRLRI